MSTKTPRPRHCRQMYVVATPIMVGVHNSIELPPAGLLRLRGTSSELIVKAEELPYRVVVIDEVDLEDGAKSALETRQAALSLADGYDGLAIDMFVPQILTLRREDVSIENSSQWFCFSYEGSTTFTHGLERFGLPEISCKTDGFTQGMVDAAIVGLVHQIVRVWPHEDPVGVHEVTLSDIARGYGQPDTHNEQRSVRLGVEYDDPYLHVTVLDDPATTIFT